MKTKSSNSVTSYHQHIASSKQHDALQVSQPNTDIDIFVDFTCFQLSAAFRQTTELSYIVSVHSFRSIEKTHLAVLCFFAMLKRNRCWSNRYDYERIMQDQPLHEAAKNPHVQRKKSDAGACISSINPTNTLSVLLSRRIDGMSFIFGVRYLYSLLKSFKTSLFLEILMLFSIR